MKEKEPFDFERFEQEAMEGLYAGKKAGGTDGVFAPLMKHLLESMLDGELNSHLEEGFFKEPKLRSEITAYYNSFLSEENHKKDSDFSAQLEDLYNEGKLLKIQGDKGQNKEDKLIRFIRNPDFKED